MNRYRVLPKLHGFPWSFIEPFSSLPGQHTWCISFNQDGSHEIEVALDHKAKVAFFETFSNDLEAIVCCPHCGECIKP